MQLHTISEIDVGFSAFSFNQKMRYGIPKIPESVEKICDLPLTRRLFGGMLRRIAALQSPAG